MNDMERRKFEDSFKDAFQDAQVSPSESVWTNIELDLERAEGGKMKRRILFYKLLAAASVSFAMCVAGVGYYTVRHQQADGVESLANANNQNQPLENSVRSADDSNTAIIDASSNEFSPSTEVPDASSMGAHKPSNVSALATENADNSSIQNTFDNDGSLVSEDRNRNGINSNNSSMVAYTKISTESTSESIIAMDRTNERFTTALNPTTIGAVKGSSSVGSLPLEIKPENIVVPAASEPDAVAVLMAKLDQREKELADKEETQKKKEEKSNERLWTSVGVAAGAFTSGNSNVESSISAFNAAAGQQAKASGVAYSMGVSIGTRLSNRWVLQGGLNYQTQSSDYTASAVVGTSDFQNFYAASINNAAVAKEDTKLLNTVPYSVNNNLQFVSVPMQAGYLVLNKKFGIQINAGLATDLFIQNTITPESGSLEKSTQGAGDSSPYRSVNFSGLVGTEITYKFGSHYRLALNPGLRYPMNSIYKSDTGVEAMPLTLDVGLRFRYIFNQ